MLIEQQNYKKSGLPKEHYYKMNLTEYKEIIAENNSEFQFFKDKIFPVVMQWEGGGKLHNVEADSGGWTIWGIAYNYWKQLFVNFSDFKDTTRDEAAHIAYVKFYLAIHADKMPYDCKLFYFDMAYNLGTSRAIKYMQECAGVTADGLIGAITIKNMHKVTEVCLKSKRDGWYNYLYKVNTKLLKFLNGWLNRSKSVYNHKY